MTKLLVPLALLAVACVGSASAGVLAAGDDLGTVPTATVKARAADGFPDVDFWINDKDGHTQLYFDIGMISDERIVLINDNEIFVKLKR